MAASAALILRESPSMKKAVSLINEIDIGRFPRLLTRILQKLHLKAENSFSEEEEEKLQAAFSLERQDLHLVLETISFILEQAVYYNVKPAALQQQLENIHLRQDKAEAFVSAWSSMGQETIEKFRQRILAPHKLETVGWQLNLQMAHSAQAKLKSPQAVLQLGVSNEDSKAADAQAQRPWLTGLADPWHVGSSRTRARTRVPCIGRQTLNHCATREAHCATREAPFYIFFKGNHLLETSL
ncbi:COMM domain-containing protein 10 isoform X2 [Lagenorhynchus albirostris]|uniref:COMM domain-containing protein 10 isoform X2 n=1 Tax=Lagenorhynchus albirostris TaxID=27610 RepID=UPI0028E56A6C|nr:COMM domain-containing protein 10 isoform X2 [Lagenorhynchus albirostris]